MDRSQLDPVVQEAIELFEASPVGRQLADPDEREGRCWRTSTRFLSVLRELGRDGDMVVWSGKGWEHGAIQIKGTNVVVDWTASQLEEDPDKAREYDFPCIRTRAEADAQWGSSYVWDFENPCYKQLFMRERLSPPLLASLCSSRSSGFTCRRSRRRLPER